MCSKCGDSSESTLIRKDQFGSKFDANESPVLAEMAVSGKKDLKRKEMWRGVGVCVQSSRPVLQEKYMTVKVAQLKS